MKNFTRISLLSLLFLLGTIPLLKAQVQTHKSVDKAHVVNSFPYYHKVTGTSVGGSAAGMQGTCHTLACCSVWVYKVVLPTAGSLRIDNYNFSPLGGSIIAYRPVNGSKTPTSFSDLNYVSSVGNFCGFRDTMQLGRGFGWNRKTGSSSGRTNAWGTTPVFQDTIGAGTYYILAWNKNNQVNRGGDSATFVFRYEPYCGGTTGRTCPPILDITGNDNSIGNGSTTATLNNTTLIDSTSIYGSKTTTYSIENSSDSFFTLSGTNPVSIDGPGASFFSVVSQPTDRSIDNTDSTTFQIKYSPTTIGSDTALVKIANSESTNDTFTFTIIGNALDLRSIAFAQKFEGTTADNWTYTPDPAKYATETDSVIGGSEDIWDIIREFTGDIDGPFDGRYFWGTQDLKNSNGGRSSAHNLNFDNVYVGDLTDPKLKFNYYSDGFDGSDKIYYQLYYDNVAQGVVNLEKNSDEWLTIRQDIPATVDSVKFVWSAYNDGATDYSGFDGLEIRGTVISAPSSQPEIKITGNNIEIASGDAIPSTGDSTTFGSIDTNSTAILVTYTITNIGTDGDTLNLTGNPIVTLSGAGSSQFSIISQPNKSQLDSGETATFQVRYFPTTVGTHSAEISIANDDSDENPYTFGIQGSGNLVCQMTSTMTLDSNAIGVSGTGGATVAAVGGKANFTYLWSNSATTASISGVSVGTYYVTITDADGCKANDSITINNFTPLVLSLVVDSNVSCNGESDGGVSSQVSGGTAPYTYLWSNAATGATITGVSGGKYVLRVIDAAMDTLTDSVTVTEATELVASAIQDSIATCNTCTDGGASVSATGGVGTYTYSWSNSATTSAITGVTKGTYYITVTDQDGCADDDSIEVFVGLIAYARIDSHVTCKGLSNGGATAIANGGTAPYTYLWSNSSTASSITGLMAGQYSIRIIDAAMDTIMDTIIISEPDTFKVAISSVTNALCFGDSNATALALAGFGTAKGGGLSENFDILDSIPMGWSTYNNFANTSPNAFWKVGPVSGSPNYGMQGTTEHTGNSGYFLWVDGSSPYPGEVSLETPTVANASSFNFWMKRNTTGQPVTKYNDFTIDVYDGTTWHDSIFYHDTMTNSGDWEEFNIDISSYLKGDSVKVRLNVDKVGLSSPFYDDIVLDDISLGAKPANFVWTLGSDTAGTVGQLTDAPAGTYKVIATSDAGCADSATVTLTEPVALSATTSIDNNISCYGLSDGEASIALTGGTTPFSYTWSHAAINNDSISGLGVDTFSVLVTDSNLCILRDTVILTQPDSLNAIASVDSNVTCNGLMDGKASIVVNGGTKTYTYAWSNASTMNALSNVPAGTYEVAIMDANGCVDSSEVTITEPAVLIAGVLTGDTSVCSGTAPGKITQVTTVAGGVGNYSYQWESSSDSSNWTIISGAASIDYQPLAVAGNTWYRRLDRDSNSCGPDTTNAIKIGVYAQPNTGFTATIACEGQQTNFTDTTSLAFGSINSYSWSFGDKGTSNQQNPINVYKNSGTYSVTLSVIADGGCNSTVTKTVSVNSVPTADFSTTADCEGEATTFTNKSTLSSGTLSYTWDLGDNNSATTSNPTHIYLNSGYYTAQLVATSSSGCIDSISRTVQVKQVAKPNFSATAVCEGNFTQFTNLSTNASTYSWDFADGTGGSKQANPKNKYKNSGIYNVVLTATSSDGCSDTAHTTVSVYSLPVAGFTATEECLGEATDFTNSSTGASSYQWVFGNGTSSNNTTPSVLYGKADNYKVELTATTTNGCTDVTSNTITVNALPEVSFTAADICLSEDLTTTNTTTGANKYDWSFGDGNTSTTKTPTHTYTANGMYEVMLVATSSKGCINSDSADVNVHAVPDVAFTATDVCFGLNTDFSNTTKIAAGTMTYVWTLGDGSTTGNPSPSYGYAKDGTYNIKLVATSNNGCKDSTTGSVNVFAMPTVDFTTASVCYGDTLFTNNLSSTANYDWSFDDGNTSTLASPFNFYKTAGEYRVQLIATTTNNCVDSLSQNISIYSKPIADFDVKDVCDETAVQFANGSYNAIITGNSWDFGDGNADNRVNPSNLYASAGGYTTTLIVTSNEGCEDTLSKTLIVHPNPVMAFTNTIECDYDSTVFTDGSTITSGTMGYAWDFGNGDVSAIPSPTYQFARAGAYKVTLIGTSDRGCIRETSSIVVVNPSPTAALRTTNNCEGMMSEFTSLSQVDAGSITAYQWSFGDGNTSTDKDPTYVYASDATYPIELVVETDQSCFDTTVSIITVYNKPTADFNTSDICFGGRSVFADASTDASEYLYDFGDKWGISTLGGPEYTYEAPGTYDATLFVTSIFGCKDTVTKTIEIYSLPTAQFGINNHCFNEDFLPKDNSKGDVAKWSWSYDDGNTANGIDPIYTYGKDGSYSVKLEVEDDNGCIDSVRKTVVVWPLPVVGIRTDTLVSKGYTVPMSATGGVEYKWSPVDNLDKPLKSNPTATVIDDIEYTVTVANEFGCTRDTFVNLRVEEDYTLEPANIMTPDGNGQNDNWIVEKAQYYNDVEVIVFDRWGRIVYQNSSYDNTWAGISSTGGDLPDGAYYYVVKVPADREEYKGSITIFR